MVTDVTLALSVTPGAPATGLTRVGVDVEAPGRSAELWRPAGCCRRLHLGPWARHRARHDCGAPSPHPLSTPFDAQGAKCPTRWNRYRARRDAGPPPARLLRIADFFTAACRRVVCACSAGTVGSFSNKPLSPKCMQKNVKHGSQSDLAAPAGQGHTRHRREKTPSAPSPDIPRHTRARTTVNTRQEPDRNRTGTGQEPVCADARPESARNGNPSAAG